MLNRCSLAYWSQKKRKKGGKKEQMDVTLCPLSPLVTMCLQTACNTNFTSVKMEKAVISSSFPKPWKTVKTLFSLHHQLS